MHEFLHTALASKLLVSLTDAGLAGAATIRLRSTCQPSPDLVWIHLRRWGTFELLRFEMGDLVGM
jgi:hypothetical protein